MHFSVVTMSDEEWAIQALRVMLVRVYLGLAQQFDELAEREAFK